MSLFQGQLSNAQRLRVQFEGRSRIPFNGLLSNRLLTRLPGPEFAHLLPYLEPVMFRTGEYIYELGQDFSHIYFPETLVITQLCYLEDGSSTGVAVVGNEGLLGLSAILGREHAQFWTLATIGGSALRIRSDELRQEFLKGGALHTLILAHANDRMSQLSRRTVCNSRHRMDERLCTFLLMIQDRTTDSSIPLTHEAISQQLGTRRAGVTNLCNVLRDNRIIDYRRAKITILDRSQLEQSACECYR